MPTQGPRLKRRGWWRLKAEERPTSPNQRNRLVKRFEKAKARGLKAWVENRREARSLESRLETLDAFLRQRLAGLPPAEAKKLQAERASLVKEWANTRARTFGNALSARIFEHLADTARGKTSYTHLSDGDQQAFVRLAGARFKKILLLRLSMRGAQPTTEQVQQLQRMQQVLLQWLNHWGLNVSETSMRDWMSGDLVRFA